MHLRLFLFIFLLPVCSAAQNFVCDGILFWDSVEWERTDVLFDWTAPGKTLAVRRYYGDRRDIREEFLRIDDYNWYFNSYDTTRAYHFRRGRMLVDTLHPRIDTTLSFDPQTYEEVWHLDTTWRLLETGFWQELDTSGFLWQGKYGYGKKLGRWSKQRTLKKDVVDFRAVDFENGIAVREKQLNMALSKDSTAVEAALTGSWISCNDRGKMYKWDGPYPDMSRCFTHHGSVTLLFLNDHSVQRCFPGYEEMQVKMGEWRLSVNNMELNITWADGERSRYRIRSLIGFEMLLQALD